MAWKGKSKEYISAHKKEWSLRNKERLKEYNKNWRLANKKKIADYNKQYAIDHPEQQRLWYARNRLTACKKIGAQTAKRKAKKLQATPKWLTKQHYEEMQKIYNKCPLGYQVDHIVPLLGKEVRGLHVPWNLQYLTKTENLKKGNKLLGL